MIFSFSYIFFKIQILSLSPTIYDHSPGSNTEQKMGQLCNILGVGTITIEKMTFFYQFPKFSLSCSIIISWTKFNELVTYSRARYNNYWNLIINAGSNFINNIKYSISYQNTNYFASAHSFRSLLSLCNFYA